ncbi:hypothetical protein [Pseudonocardia oroxyli]|nr:hypothetical protein [Pseudonocardia oroxyli]
MTGVDGGPGPEASMLSAHALRAGLALSDMSITDLWLAAVALGATMTLDDLAATVALQREPAGLEHDMVAAALNDWFVDHWGRQPVAYSDELRPP